VTGGHVYQGHIYPDLEGIYFYADFCSGRIWGLRQDSAAWESALVYDAPFRITSFGRDEPGNVWLTRYADAPSGAIYRLAQTLSVYVPISLR
jgi:hypothetical protein